LFGRIAGGLQGVHHPRILAVGGVISKWLKRGKTETTAA
jgi:hypothetical protein